MSFHLSDVPTNVLTLNEYDPISGTAEFKACAVKITPIASEEAMQPYYNKRLGNNPV